MLLILNSAEKAHEYVLPKGQERYLLLDSSKPDVLEDKLIETAKYRQAAHSLSLWKMTCGGACAIK
jgi:hypothetical protein